MAMSRTTDAPYRNLVAAFGGDSLAVRTANCMFREGLRSLPALSELATVLGDRDFRHRIADIRNMGEKSVGLVMDTVRAYREGRVTVEGARVRFTPYMARDDSTEEIEGLYSRAQYTRSALAKLDAGALAVPGEEFGMTNADLLTMLTVMVGATTD